MKIEEAKKKMCPFTTERDWMQCCADKCMAWVCFVKQVKNQKGHYVLENDKINGLCGLVKYE